MRARRRRSQRLRSSKRVTCLRKSTRLLRFSATAVSGGGPNSARAGTDVSNEAVSAGRGSKSFLIPGRLTFVFTGPLPRTGRRLVGRRDEVLHGRRLGHLWHDILLSASQLSWVHRGAPSPCVTRSTGDPRTHGSRSALNAPPHAIT